MNRMIALGAIVSALCGASAFAQTDGMIVHQEIVSYADLDLNNERGQKALNHRINHAIRKACGEASQTDLAGSNAVRRCHNDLRHKITSGMHRASGVKRVMFTYYVAP